MSASAAPRLGVTIRDRSGAARCLALADTARLDGAHLFCRGYVSHDLGIGAPGLFELSHCTWGVRSVSRRW